MRERRPLPVRALQLCGLALALAAAWAARDRYPWARYPHRYILGGISGEEETRAVAPVARELDALEKSGVRHPWAGTYSGPGGFTVSTIRVAPSGRYCEGTWFDGGGAEEGWCGRLRLEGRRLVTRFPITRWERMQPDGPPFDLVPWGTRTYLVPERRMQAFVNAVNAGQEPRYSPRDEGSYDAYLRSGDEEVPVGGLPDVPAEYRGMLLGRPLRARLLRVGRRERVAMHGDPGEDLVECYTRVTLDVGESSGLRRGMDLEPERFRLLAVARVEYARPGEADARLRQDCGEPPAKAGDPFSTRDPLRPGVVASTQGARVVISRLTGRRYAPFMDGYPEWVLSMPKESDLRRAGFTVEAVARARFVPPWLRSGLVWPALVRDGSGFGRAVADGGRAAEARFERDHPGEAKRCRGLENAASDATDEAADMVRERLSRAHGALPPRSSSGGG